MYLHKYGWNDVLLVPFFLAFCLMSYFNGPLECIWLSAAETQSPLEQVFCLVFRTSSRYNCSWLSPLNFQLGEGSLNGSFFLSKGSGWKKVNFYWKLFICGFFIFSKWNRSFIALLPNAYSLSVRRPSSINSFAFVV